VTSPEADTKDASVAPDDDFTSADFDAIESMDAGDFTVVASMLREGVPLHWTVRQLLAASLDGSNKRGQLRFHRAPHAPANDPDIKTGRQAQTFEGVEMLRRQNPRLSTLACIQRVAETPPARSFQSVRADYYAFKRIADEFGYLLPGGTIYPRK
jgi:hypothetical protein